MNEWTDEAHEQEPVGPVAEERSEDRDDPDDVEDVVRELDDTLAVKILSSLDVALAVATRRARDDEEAPDEERWDEGEEVEQRRGRKEGPGSEEEPQDEVQRLRWTKYK